MKQIEYSEPIRSTQLVPVFGDMMDEVICVRVEPVVTWHTESLIVADDQINTVTKLLLDRGCRDISICDAD